MANISEVNLNVILSANEVSLKKLSIESLDINQETLDVITGKHVELEALNISLCRSTEDIAFSEALPTNLRELNMAWCEAMNAVDVIPLLPTNLDRLNLSGHREEQFNDESLGLLISKCPKLHELDISDCHEMTSDALIIISRGLLRLRALNISRCYYMTDFEHIRKILSLRNLSAFGLTIDTTLSPRVKLNEELFSTVARPTVGLRRSSIWNIRLTN